MIDESIGDTGLPGKSNTNGMVLSLRNAKYFKSRFTKGLDYQMQLKENYEPIQWETIKDVAKRFPFSADWFYEMAAKGQIPCYKHAGKWLFIPEEMDHFFKGKRHNAPPLSKARKYQKKIDKGVRSCNISLSGKSEGMPFQKAKEK